MKKAIVTEIVWDLDGEEDVDEILATLPKRMEFEVEDGLTDDEAEEFISDAITDETEWCHKGFKWKYVK